MYIKPPRKQFQGGIYVPENYHGTAFTEPEAEQPIEQEPAAEPQPAEQNAPLPDAVQASKKEEGGLLSSLFSGLGSFRSDDLLLLALIVLLWSSKDEHGASEILPLLALLLFLG